MGPIPQAQHIAIDCPNWVGDAVMATPALRCVRRNYPEAQIVFIIRPYLRGIFEDAPWYDGILEYEPPADGGPFSWQKGAVFMLRAAQRLRQEKLDLALLLKHSFRSALLARLAGAKRRVANSRGDQKWLLTDYLMWPRQNGERLPLPKVEAYMRLCELLELKYTDERALELFYSPAVARKAEELVVQAGGNPQQPMFGIVPGASFGSAKFWDCRKFAQVADALIERHGWQAAVLCGPGEEELGRKIGSYMSHRCLQFDPQELSLSVLKPMIARCELLVTTDTGPRHIGTAFRVPTVVIMGPTDPRHTKTGYDKEVVLRKDVPCGPCHLRECPTDHRCMKLITADMVLEAAENLLRSA
ncbi:MAG: lipopolysaccharide heptosyltransferase II [Planctomycetes bacterium]|nr:lipopolysaccharide heptosyltransferase II [Planctomycetota bacterium]